MSRTPLGFASLLMSVQRATLAGRLSQGCGGDRIREIRFPLVHNLDFLVLGLTLVFTGSDL